MAKIFPRPIGDSLLLEFLGVDLDKVLQSGGQPPSARRLRMVT